MRGGRKSSRPARIKKTPGEGGTKTMFNESSFPLYKSATQKRKADHSLEGEKRQQIRGDAQRNGEDGQKRGETKGEDG